MTITLYWLIFNLCPRSSINLVSRTSKEALPKVSANRWIIFHVFLFVDLDLWMNGSALKFNSYIYILLPHIFYWHWDWQSCIMLSWGFLFEHWNFLQWKMCRHMHWLPFVGNCKNLNFVPFAIAGFCEFGNGCRFSHLTEEKRRELEQQCELE